MAAKSKMTTPRGVSIILALTSLALVLAGCNTSSVLNSKETFRQGFVIDDETLALVPVGSSREQVLLSLGSPTTTNAFDDNRPVFYYISQTRVRNAQFLKAKIVDQRVLAVYFDQTETVERIVDYGLKDGKVFDFKKGATPTGGKDTTFLAQIFAGGMGASASQVLGR